jgi:hypothetical protein
MKRFAGPVVAAVGWLASWAACEWLLRTYAPGYTSGALFLEAGVIVKLVMLLILMLFLPLVGLGLAALIAGRGQLNIALSILAALFAGFGILGALYVVMNIQIAIGRVGPVSFAVTAPSYAEAALVASMGLLGATAALGLRLLGDRRR